MSELLDEVPIVFVVMCLAVAAVHLFFARRRNDHLEALATQLDLRLRKATSVSDAKLVGLHNGVPVTVGFRIGRRSQGGLVITAVTCTAKLPKTISRSLRVSATGLSTPFTAYFSGRPRAVGHSDFDADCSVRGASPAELRLLAEDARLRDAVHQLVIVGGSRGGLRQRRAVIEFHGLPADLGAVPFHLELVTDVALALAEPAPPG